eukprot:Clim_evm78s150 gene=Clim_evmTU78s150
MVTARTQRQSGAIKNWEITLIVNNRLKNHRLIELLGTHSETTPSSTIIVPQVGLCFVLVSGMANGDAAWVSRVKDILQTASKLFRTCVALLFGVSALRGTASVQMQLLCAEYRISAVPACQILDACSAIDTYAKAFLREHRKATKDLSLTLEPEVNVKAITSILKVIPSVNNLEAVMLQRHFGSLREIAKASRKDLRDAVQSSAIAHDIDHFFKADILL